MKYLKLINEYLKTEDNIALYKYFNMTPEQKKSGLAYEFPQFYSDFCDDTGLDDKLSTEYQYEELANILQTEYPIIYNKYNEWLYDKICDFVLPIDYIDYPAWVYYEKPSIIKEQWLIHFTNNASDIYKNGFIKGVSEIERLSLTKYISDISKEDGGYNFAYTVSDLNKYIGTGYTHKYGKGAVIFRCSGIRLYHKGDKEHQVIFFGKLATNINIIYKREKWEIHSNSGKAFFRDYNINNAVDWFVNNYDQYKKHLK